MHEVPLRTVAGVRGVLELLRMFGLVAETP